MNNNFACLLVFHGSRNPHYTLAISKLVNLVREKLTQKLLVNCDCREKETVPIEASVLATITHPQQATLASVPLVGSAVLEFADVSLAKAITNFARKAISLNYERVAIVPVFLSAGVHVKEDIPTEVDRAKHLLKNSIPIELLDYVGNYPQLTNLIVQQYTQIGVPGKILLAHGSRLPLGNIASKQLACEVNAKNAYWTVSPDLASVVEEMVKLNLSSIAILPYFLFTGRITNAIAEKVVELQARFPQTKLLLGQPFGTSPQLARMISDRLVEL